MNFCRNFFHKLQNQKLEYEWPPKLVYICYSSRFFHQALWVWLVHVVPGRFTCFPFHSRVVLPIFLFCLSIYLHIYLSIHVPPVGRIAVHCSGNFISWPIPESKHIANLKTFETKSVKYFNHSLMMTSVIKKAVS